MKRTIVIDRELKKRLIGHRTVHVSLRLPARFVALVDLIAAKNGQSRTGVLVEVFMLGLHDYATLYKLASVLVGEHDSNDVLAREHAPQTVPTSEHKSEDAPADEHNQTNRRTSYRREPYAGSNLLHVKCFSSYPVASLSSPEPVSLEPDLFLGEQLGFPRTANRC